MRQRYYKMGHHAIFNSVVDFPTAIATHLYRYTFWIPIPNDTWLVHTGTTTRLIVSHRLYSSMTSENKTVAVQVCLHAVQCQQHKKIKLGQILSIATENPCNTIGQPQQL